MAATAFEPSASPATAVVDQPAPSAPAPIPRNAPDIPRVALELPTGSDLVLVETSRAATRAEPPESETPRAHRVRPPRPEVKDEPLEMVETTRKEPPSVE